MKKSITLPLLMTCSLYAFSSEKPNIIIVYIDDMGYSDLACYGGKYTPTPNMDKLADEGIKFTQYYSAAPISSPSRAGLMTGMYPTRWGINTYLQTREGNATYEQNDYLDDRAPSIARALKENGYATGHFGKWHMGGGRDVYNAPSIYNYGFDEYVSTWESPDPDPKLTSTNWIWADTDEIKRWDRTSYFVDKTLDFLSRHPDEPCFVNLWPDDVHTPWVFEDDNVANRESEASFTVVLAELDVQIGRLMEGLKNLGIDNNTLVIFTSDNGPAPAFSGNRTDDLRGQKGTLYEGGIRMPFIVRWPGTITPGQIDSTSVLCSVDLFSSLCSITGTSVPTEFPLDGENMSQALLGKEQINRTKPLFWEFGKDLTARISPHIAVRENDWKLLVNADGSTTELYNMKTDYLEKTNVASSNPDVVNYLKPLAIDWFKSAFREYADNIVRVAVDGNEANDGSSWNSATTLTHAVELSQEMSGVKIWLKSGTYLVTSSLNFDNLAIYGGFSGNEANLEERNWKDNQSILDGGNLVSPLRNNNLTGTVSSVLDGVIIQNGINQSDANGGGNGGGMILASGSVIRNCIFRNNRTQNSKNGAALHCNYGTITIENSLFVNNTSTGNGGAIQVGGNTTAIVSNCTFANNKSTKPGGAIGLGASTSNLTLNNTVAYNNLYGSSTYNSYGQNDNINAGGVVLSRYSAIESTSTKFSDGDDVSHITLSQSNGAGFVSPSTVIGYTNVAGEIEEIESASYELTENSPCIDAGNNTYASLSKDLAGNDRIYNTTVDMGAYEYKLTTLIPYISDKAGMIVWSANGSIQVKGAKKNDILKIYDIAGSLVYQRKLTTNDENIGWKSKGVYFVKIENTAFKLLMK